MHAENALLILLHDFHDSTEKPSGVSSFMSQGGKQPRHHDKRVLEHQIIT